MSDRMPWPEPLELWASPTVARIERATYDRESRVAELDFRLTNPDLELTLVFKEARVNVSREYHPKEMSFDLVTYEPIRIPWPEFQRFVDEANPKIAAEKCTVRPVRNMSDTWLERLPEHDSPMVILIRYGTVDFKGVDSLESLAVLAAANIEAERARPPEL